MKKTLIHRRKRCINCKIRMCSQHHVGDHNIDTEKCKTAIDCKNCVLLESCEDCNLKCTCSIESFFFI
jgi:hypothetical protein